MRANTRLRLAWFALAVAIGVASCRVDVARAEAPARFDVELIAPAGDSVCFGMRWTPVAGAESYGLVVTTDRAGDPEQHLTFPDEQGWVCAASPAAGDTLTLNAVAWGVRAGTKGYEKTYSWHYSTALPPLPAPDSIWVDSIVPPSKPDSSPTSPPAGDVGSDSTPPVVASLFATPRPESPHFDFIRRTFTDFCYCWDGALGQIARQWAASRYDLVMSGSAPAWLALNANLTQLRYALMQTSFSEEADKYGKTDANSLTGKWQYDARRWFSEHPKYDYERMWLHRADSASSTPADSAHRLRKMIWNNWRYAINPMDPGARAYTVDRLLRIADEFPESHGLFLDEMDRHALGWSAQSREGIGVDSATWENAIVTLVSQIRDSIAPRMLQTNAAEYSTGPFDQRVGEAAGSMHLELMNSAQLPLPDRWDFVDSLLAHGTYVDFVGREMWSDYQSATWQRKYPGGFYGSAAERLRVVQLASYYMVVGQDPQKLGLQSENVRTPYRPDSTSQRIYELDVGHPTEARRVVLDTRDSLNQRVKVYQRRFDRAVVMIRPMTYWSDTLWTGNSAVPVPLPAGGPWSYVTAGGNLVPIDSLALKESDAVILVRRQQ